MRIETERLILRDLTMDDLDGLYEILSDTESMKHYPRPFTKDESIGWINRNINRYNEHGFGLWGMELKEGNMFIGDCGITIQNIDGVDVPEIGYHVNKRYGNKGYATEAAQACRDYAFESLGFEKIYSYMKYSNLASSRVAEKNGMKFEFEYDDPKNKVTKVYSITREEYNRMK